MTQVKCFICYAHEDLEMVDRLHGTYLEALRHHPALQDMEIWRDREIVAGDKWNVEIEREIATADVFLMLLSDDWFGSKFIRECERPAIERRAEHGGAVMIPILLSDCGWQRVFRAAQVAPLDERLRPKPIASWQPPADGYRKAADAVEQAIQKLLADPDHAAAQRPQSEFGYRWVAERHSLAIDSTPDPADAEVANDPITRDWHDAVKAKAASFAEWIPRQLNSLDPDWRILVDLAARFAKAVEPDLGKDQRELDDAWRAHMDLAKELERHADRRATTATGAPLTDEAALELRDLVSNAGFYLNRFPTVRARDALDPAPVPEQLQQEIRDLVAVARARGLISGLDADAVTDGLVARGSHSGAAARFALLSARNLIVKMCSQLAIERIGAQKPSPATRLSDCIRNVLRECAPRIGSLRDSLPYDLRHACDLSLTDAIAPRAPSGGDPFWSDGQRPAWVDGQGCDKFGPWVTFRVPGTQLTQRMRWCPKGDFMRGSPDSDKDADTDERPQRRVSFAQGFWMFDTTITEALWLAVMGTAPRRPLGDRFPVTEVNWFETQDFVRRLNDRLPGLDLSLPSEAAWEYACRAGTTTLYSFGDRITRTQVNFDGREPVPVASLPANPWGLYEMHGNVWEWCLDHRHRDYNGAPDDGSAWVDDGARGAAHRVIRGGSGNVGARGVRAACRGGGGPASCAGYLGFRCVRVRSEIEAAGAAAPAPLPNPVNAGRAGPGVGATAFRRRTVPEWAVDAGDDKFGRYAILQVPGTQVTQRLRWIKPDRFFIGSPPSEIGRSKNESPQTAVTFADGFWLFDTPVTQELWQAVIGDNPSQFRSPTRPVETVNHEDARSFIARLNALTPGLRLSLPSEAEWEFACRAGTAMATWRGNLGEDETRFAPILDDIAWYIGNSHDGFELDNGFDVGATFGKPRASLWAGTRPVALKSPNDWGLYDMLGNVWEWCSDNWHDNHDGVPTDGTARPADSDAFRVVRGGSWINDAADARAAYRNGRDPAGLYGNLGFRCARVQSESEAARRAGGASEASGAKPRRRTSRRGA